MAPEPGLPSTPLRDSDDLGWRAVRAVHHADPAEADAFTTRSADLLLVLVTGGRYRIESRAGGRWRAATYRPGSMGVTAPGNPSVLRWRAAGPEPMTSLHLHLRPDGVPGTDRFPDALTLHDPYAGAAARALGAALRDGAPGLYADAVAHALVTHLALRVAPPRRPAASPAAALGDRELARVVDHMHAHLHTDVTLADLAAQAAVSKYHFLRMFTATTGLTPHRYLTRLRMRHAAALLRDTTLSVGRIAADSGYRSTGQFAAAFRREYGCRPTEYRNRAG